MTPDRRVRCDGCEEPVDYEAIRVGAGQQTGRLMKGHPECIEQTFTTGDFSHSLPPANAEATP